MIERETGSDSGALSPAGRARRDQILVELQGTMVRRRRRTVAVRAGGAALAGAIAVGVLLRPLIFGTGTPTPRPETAGGHPTGTLAGTVVRDDPLVLAKFSVVPGPSRVASVDDDELARLLHEAGQPSGLVRTGGRVYVTSDLAKGAPDADAAPGT